MTKEESVKKLTDLVADFVGYIGKKLPDDVVAKLKELGCRLAGGEVQKIAMVQYYTEKTAPYSAAGLKSVLDCLSTCFLPLTVIYYTHIPQFTKGGLQK